jgi:hypothetical protein
MQGYDKGTIKHKLNVLERKLPKPGIANTVAANGIYFFDADTQLDYSTAIGSNTLVTISQLPTNTIFIIAWVGLGDNTCGDTVLRWKKKSTDTLYYDFQGDGAAVARNHSILIMPTHQNTFYVTNFRSSLYNYFHVIGYGVA